MGCGNSTLASENADIEAKVRPMLKRRIDDLKRRRNFVRDSTLSKKELLAGEDCDKNSTNNDSVERKSSPPEDSRAAKIFPAAEEEEDAKTIVECLKENEDKIGEVHEKEITQGAEETEQENRAEDESELEEEEDDDGRCISISPGSPSFRVYCVTEIPHDPDDDDDRESHIGSPEENSETKSSKEHPAESAEKDSSATRNSKGRTMNKKIKRAMIHKGGHVKSLLRVKSCYNPSCSAHVDKAHLLQEEAPA